MDPLGEEGKEEKIGRKEIKIKNFSKFFCPYDLTLARHLEMIYHVACIVTIYLSFILFYKQLLWKILSFIHSIIRSFIDSFIIPFFLSFFLSFFSFHHFFPSSTSGSTFSLLVLFRLLVRWLATGVLIVLLKGIVTQIDMAGVSKFFLERPLAFLPSPQPRGHRSSVAVAQVSSQTCWKPASQDAPHSSA